MSARYQPAYSEAALEALLAADAEQRATTRAAVLRLCRTPGRAGDYRQPDETGRMMKVVLIDEVVVTFWVDHAVREVRITAIEFP